MAEEQKEHGTVRSMVDKVQDTVGGVAGRVAASGIDTADSFVENAAIGDMYEIRAARVALRRSSSPLVHAIAKRMVTDHTTSLHHLQAALEMNETKGVTPPPMDLDARRRKMLEHLEAASDDRFDSTYLDQQVLAHEETATLLTNYRDDGDNAQLRSLAAAAPVVQRHLEHVKALKAQGLRQ